MPTSDILFHNHFFFRRCKPNEEEQWGKKITLTQLVLLVALITFWAGSENRGAVEPVQRQIVTNNEDGKIVCIWSYDSDKKQWNAVSLNFKSGTMQESSLSTRTLVH